MISISRFRLGAVLWLSCVLVGIAVAQPPAEPGKLSPQGYVSDYANVLDASSRTQLERYCETVEKSAGVQMAIVTVTTIGERPIEDFANALFHQWGIGDKKGDQGVMLLLAVRDRKNRIEVGYGLEPSLPDGFVGSVLREMRPSLREGNYGQALIAGTAEIGARIAEAKGVTLDRTLARRDAPTDTDGGRAGGLPIGTIVIILLVLFFLTRRGGGGGFLSGMILGNVLGGSRYRGGGWGGGGFGGYDGGGGGGGGFGGFGGGDSGGGGASGSW